MPYLVNTWLFTMVINGKDVIPLGMLDSATVIEDAGSILPTFECKFSITEPSLLQYLNEGNKITLTIGRNFEECVRGKYVIHRVEQGHGETGEITVYVNGIYDAVPFLQNAKTAIYSNKNSYEVMEEVGKKYFTMESSLLGGYKSDDKMNWVQSGICDKKFFNNVWIHSYSPNDTPVVGITAEGKMRIRSLKSIYSVPTIYFGTKRYYYDPNYNLSQNTRWNNMNGGYGKVRVQDDIESGFGNISLSDVFANQESGRSSELPRTSEASPKMGQTKFMNENIHEHYWDAQSANISNLMAMNNVTLTFTYKNFWNKIHVLDCIWFQDYMNKESNIVVSGKYVITKISRHIQNNQLMTLVQCVRQNVNDSKGNFLTSLLNGGIGEAASSIINSVVDTATQAGQTIISSTLNNTINSVLSGSEATTILSDVQSMLSSSLSLGEYSDALSSITSALTSAIGEGNQILSSFPSISSITDKITEFINFDSGGLLEKVFGANLSDILNGEIGSFISSNLSGIANNVMGNFGLDLGGLIGGMDLAYRTAADASVRSLIDNLKSAIIKI